MSTCSTTSPLVASAELPKSADGDPVFAEPWQAAAFAMTVRLHEQCVFSWSEWAEALSAELHKPGRKPDGSDYYDCWVAALSHLVEKLSITSGPELEALVRSWQRAAEGTPHGKPIVLENDPLRRG
ncbi:nitrile hydratase accessory protein [Sinorhizobium sp. CCBAU 05631]|uniref:nitrile hydratase accessory protein n=1 Tax=Sinorhizobium sp. CCBAU 05631 TaxID=794846 RepID=UPI0004B01AA3|nr:nitrile hydratase accessory protein [Sinorhizobium sp. CCBAU 05631]ASY57101.1 putative metal chaperone, involved in Fe-nitrile hydratase activation [Sinorhizobium sp. CCBAU 05631]